MQQALELAQLASCHNEVPVGAVIVKNGEVIAKGFNLCIQNSDPTAHAEIVAIRQATALLQNYRLEDCELYVTLEPCCMCAGAILNSRIKRVVYGASDLKAGAAGSVIDLFENPTFNHQTAITKGVLNEESVTLLQNFFQEKRLVQSKVAQSTKLREDFLRLPTTLYTEFIDKNQLANFSHFDHQLSSLNGARLHYLDSGITNSQPDLHGQKSILILPGLMQASDCLLEIFHYYKNLGIRVLLIDLIGMGFSDKPKKLKHESFKAMENFHLQYLDELLRHLKITSFDIVAANLSWVFASALQSNYNSTHIYLPTNTSALLLPEIKSWNHFKKIVTKNDELSQSVLLPYPDKGHFEYLHHLFDLYDATQLLSYLSHIKNHDTDNRLFTLNDPLKSNQLLHLLSQGQSFKLGKQSFLCINSPYLK
jgi:tRNA(adenine34) deaminase